jgi:hypothetical protein
MSEENPVDTIRESIDTAKSRGVFSIANLLRDRAYPKSSVAIFLDEGTAHELLTLDQRISKLKNPASPDAVELVGARDKLAAKLDESKVVVHLTGISEGERDKLVNEAVVKYPREFVREMDLMEGKMVKEEKESPERDALFTDLLWLKSIERLEDAEGNVQESLSYSDIREMRHSLPLAASSKISNAIQDLRIATALFMAEVDEGFLAKP